MNKNNQSFDFPSCKCIIFSSIAITVILYICVYFAFKGPGVISSGIDLEKSDWLSFLGSYLSFAGTTIVSGIAVFQTYYYAKRNKEQTTQKRAKDIQPIFSISIEAMNTMLAGSAEAFDPYDLRTLPKHKNFTLKIENVGAYPIKHVIIFESYITQLLKSNETYSLQGAYEDSPDYATQNKHIVRIIQSEYERSDKGLPKWFEINYEDVDGNDMYQVFELKDFDGQDYYALAKISEI